MPAGVTRRVGGLGWRMGDQGSAYWIAARALEAVGAMHDGLGTVTHLAESLCTAARVPGIAGLIQWSATATPGEVAALGPAVLACAATGDPVAANVRDSAVSALVRLAVAAGASRLPVAMSGGLARARSTAARTGHRGTREEARRDSDPARHRPMPRCAVPGARGDVVGLACGRHRGGRAAEPRRLVNGLPERPAVRRRRMPHA